MKNNNILPHFRKDMSTLFVLSAGIALLLAISPLLLSHFIQPVQATVLYTSVQTPNPVALGDTCSSNSNAQITFEGKGSPSSSGDTVTLTSGTFQVTDISSGQLLWSGNLYSGSITGYDPNTEDTNVEIVYNVANNSVVCEAGEQLWVYTYCTQEPPSPSIVLETDGGAMGGVNGAVDCGNAGDTTAQPSPSSSPSSSMTGTTTTTQDSDGDGIPDSSDKCIHNSNQRCFKEGNSTTTTHEQEQPPSTSSNNRTGNQTR
jgi:hypothetical protein